jgi:hypothetical protein
MPRTDVAAINGGLGGSETQTDVLVPSSSRPRGNSISIKAANVTLSTSKSFPQRVTGCHLLARSGALDLDLRVLEDMGLLLVSTLRLDRQLSRHVCDSRLVERWRIGCRRRGSSSWMDLLKLGGPKVRSRKVTSNFGRHARILSTTVV